jgi:hypothetical protein
MTRLGTALNAVTAGVAVAAYAQWQRERRRRPEVKVDWWWSVGSRDAGYQPWPHGEPIASEPGATLWIRTAVTNVGDATGERAVLNFLAPAAVTIDRWDHTKNDYVPPRDGAENPRVGTPPVHAVRWFLDECVWTPGLTWVHHYRITLPEGDGAHRFAVEVADPRLDARGARRTPATVEVDEHGRFDVRQLRAVAAP